MTTFLTGQTANFIAICELYRTIMGLQRLDQAMTSKARISARQIDQRGGTAEAPKPGCGTLILRTSGSAVVASAASVLFSFLNIDIRRSRIVRIGKLP